MSSRYIPSLPEVKHAVYDLMGEVDYDEITRKELTIQLENRHGWDLSAFKDTVKDSLRDFFC